MGQKISLENIQTNNYFYEEAIKTLRTNIQFCGNGIKTIMFTSSIPNEGKSDTAFSLAASFGSIGKKVLLLDADIRKSVLVKRYGIKEKTNGLSQYLSGQKTEKEIIYATNLENLDVILAGPYSPNPAELLEESLFKQLLDDIRDSYDYIIIDTPPMANLIDGAIVGSLCDGAVLVIETGTVSYRLVQKVKSQLERSGCRILGVVLSRVGAEENTPYYKKYYGAYGKYRKYYRRYGEEDYYGPEQEKKA